MSASHWEAAYAGGPTAVSWFEPTARVSLELIAALGVPPESPVLDVGGGASPLAAELAARGYEDVTVLDIAEPALGEGRGTEGAVRRLHADVLTWRPDRTYRLWHDRALLHFFTGDADVESYRRTLHSAVAAGGCVLLGVFAPDGPDRCSNLPVRRYSADDLADLLGRDYELRLSRRDRHVTPRGKEQAFTWAGFTRTTESVGHQSSPPVRT